MPVYTLTQNPKNIPGLKIWVDSSDVSTLSLTGIGSVTASVISIKDKISGITFSSLGSKRPLYYYNIINNKNSIFTTDTNANTRPCFLQSSTINFFGPTFSFYAVTRWQATASSYGAWPISLAPATRGANTYPDLGIPYYALNNAAVMSTRGPSFNTFIYLATRPTNGNNSNINTIGVDLWSTRNSLGVLSKGLGENVSNERPFYTMGTSSVNSSTNRITIGNYFYDNPNSTGFVGYFCELIWYNRYLSDHEHNKVVQYLKNKWIG